MWRSLVARSLWEREAPSSNLGIPTCGCAMRVVRNDSRFPSNDVNLHSIAFCTMVFDGVFAF